MKKGTTSIGNESSNYSNFLGIWYFFRGSRGVVLKMQCVDTSYIENGHWWSQILQTYCQPSFLKRYESLRVEYIQLWTRCVVKGDYDWSWLYVDHLLSLKKSCESLLSLGGSNFNLWLVVSTHLKYISQIGNLPQVGVKIKNVSNHLVLV